jgi:hypothetical protein
MSELLILLPSLRRERVGDDKPLFEDTEPTTTVTNGKANGNTNPLL